MSKTPSDPEQQTEDIKSLSQDNAHNQKKSPKKKASSKKSNAPVKADKTLEMSTQKTAGVESVHPSRTGVWLGGLALLVASVATGLGGYDYWRLQNQAKQSRQLATAQAELNQRVEAQAQTADSLQRKLAAEIDARESLAAEQIALNTAWENMSATLGRSTVAWRLAEVEYLLSIANHRLTLARDKATAVSIFASADQRIRAIGDPRLLPIRQHIADELSALRALEEPDIAGIVLTLGSLIEQAAKLPLIDTQRIAVATEDKSKEALASWRELPRVIWEDIKSLVQVRRHQQPTEPLLPPLQAWYLTQNLQLKLEQARLAALQGDTALFRQHLGEAEHWIAEFFDKESTVVSAIRESLKALAAVELSPGLPDVSASLRSLREFMAQQAVQSSSMAAPVLEGAPGS